MHILFLLLVLILAACASPSAPTPTLPPETPIEVSFIDPAQAPTSTFTDPVMREAEANYQLYCAHCHGYQGEGQLVGAPMETERLGMKPVPPHDSTGNLWRYADPLIYDVIRYGIQNPLNQYAMVAYGAVFTDEQIAALVEYIKLWWTDEQRAHQAEVTANYLEARAEAGMLDITPTAVE